MKKNAWIALAVLTGINLLNYIDRYIFSALLPAMQKDLQLSDTQMGLLGSGFILAYVVVTPFCGWWGDKGPRLKLMSAGVGLWSLATAFSGIAHSFWSQLFTRITVGFGESVYSVVAPSVLADHFGKISRGKVFAIYSGAIPVGSALGYMIGGLLEARFGWEKAFFVVGIPGVLFALLLLFLKEPARGQAEDAPVAKESSAHYFKTCALLMHNGGYLFTVLGYAAYTFVVGGLAFWMPTYIVRYFEVSLEKGNILFGGVTVAGGFVGTLLGGWLADVLERRQGNGYLKVAVLSMITTLPLFVLTLQARDFQSFMIVLFFMEVALFLCISPLDAAVINYVRPAWRSSAMALNIFLIHVLGDGISRTLIGGLSDSSDLRSALGFCPWVLALAGALWFIGLIFYWQPLPWPAKALRLPRFQAHRGLWKPTGLQENTLAAFRKAREQGAKMVELDTQLTGDGQALVFHDIDLQRLAKQNLVVSAMSAAEVQKYTPAPLLIDVLQDPSVTEFINIELKTSSVKEGDLEIAVAQAVQLAKAENRVLFSSFNPFSLRRLSKLLPDVPRALLVTEEYHQKNKMYLRKMLLGSYARVHMINLDQDMITEERMWAWNERGMPVAAWTVNEPAQIEKFLGWKVRSIISDECATPGACGKLWE